MTLSKTCDREEKEEEEEKGVKRLRKYQAHGSDEVSQVTLLMSHQTMSLKPAAADSTNGLGDFQAVDEFLKQHHQSVVVAWGGRECNQ
ncbi:hypothetical protein BASA81_002497 [Batrachochytrium salamandrivorans]|nr:hypothetical protein BASA81_002497 [Batrachochytrium salamandrivorans]